MVPNYSRLYLFLLIMDLHHDHNNDKKLFVIHDFENSLKLLLLISPFKFKLLTTGGEYLKRENFKQLEQNLKHLICNFYFYFFT